MSLVSDCNSDETTAITLLKANDVTPGVMPMDVVLNPTHTDKSGAKTSADVVTVSRSGGEWVPITISEMPINTNTLNIMNSNDMRPTITTITSNTRTIAPKPVTTTSTIPIAGSIGSNLDKTQTVIITTSSDSSVNSTISGNKYGINKVIPIGNHIALVTSPDGTSMLAVPMSSLVAKGNVNIKSSIAPMSISQTTLKAKSSVMTPLKILPLIASTTSSATITVPTLSHAKTGHTLIAPASVAINKGLSGQSFSATNTGVSLIPASISKFVSTESLPEITVPSSVGKNGENAFKEGTVVKTEDNIHCPLPPPLLAQNSTFLTNPLTNSQILTPPALTSIMTYMTTNSNIETNNKSKEMESESSDTTDKSCKEMDSVMQLINWKDGMGVLPGSDLNFRVNELGHLDVISDNMESQVSTTSSNASGHNGIKVEENSLIDNNVTQEAVKIEVKSEANIEVKTEVKSETKESDESDESETTRKCITCGERGPADTFIRQGRFCSKSCATLISTDLKLLAKRNRELSSNTTTEDEIKCLNKKTEAIKSRKQVVEPIVYQTENSNHTADADADSNEDANEEIEDVETNTGNYVDNASNGPAFSWRQYLTKTNSLAVPVKCFNEYQTFPIIKNNFKVGMKLEGVDPQHPSKFCVLSVAEVCGHRIRLHFDGYKEIFDFWVNCDNPFIFAAGFCEQTQRQLEPPNGLTVDEFNWNRYLQQTRAVAAPKHLFASSNANQLISANGFGVGMKLEAVDRANTVLVCVATIADIIGDWLLIHFDGWDDSYDYWVETTSPFIHAINWCRTKGRSLTPPKDYYRSSEKFVWEEYLLESKSQAVFSRLFKTRASNNFKVGMKLEAVDKRNPQLIRVCTVSHRQSYCIKLHFDGWDDKYDFWVDDDSPDIHPVNWCHKTSYPLQPPPTADTLSIKDSDGLISCPTPGCLGIGHIRGPKYTSHTSTVSCPYTDSRLDYELPDRLAERNADSVSNEDVDESQVSPSQSPSPSESNSINSSQRNAKTVKSQQMTGNKGRKRKLGSNPTNGTNGGPVSPSTNSESAKHSRPSTPSSITNLSSLQHSIFAMRMSQQQQEAPVCWDRHSKTTLPGIDKTKSKDVLLWTPSKVSEFIDQIPGCETVGQIFADQLIDGEAFLLLNQNDIVKILGLKLGPAIKIFNSILVIRDNAINEDNV